MGISGGAGDGFCRPERTHDNARKCVKTQPYLEGCGPCPSPSALARGVGSASCAIHCLHLCRLPPPTTPPPPTPSHITELLAFSTCPSELLPFSASHLWVDSAVSGCLKGKQPLNVEVGTWSLGGSLGRAPGLTGGVRPLLAARVYVAVGLAPLLFSSSRCFLLFPPLCQDSSRPLPPLPLL